MADDSELDYLRTFIKSATGLSSVRHFSEIRKIDSIKGSRRILIYPPELMNIDGKFYNKRYKVQMSDTSEVALNSTFNAIVNSIDFFNRNNTLENYLGISFTDETVGARGLDIDFITGGYNDGADSYTEININEDGHQYVLYMFDNDAGGDTTGFTHTFTEERNASGANPIIEFWIKVKDSTEFIGMRTSHTGDEVVLIKIDAGKLQYFIVGWNDVTGGTITNDTWYHIKLDIDLSAETFDIYINEVLKDNDVSGIFDSSLINNISFTTASTGTNSGVYLDAFGFYASDGWADGLGYNLGDNFDAYSKPSVLTYISMAYGNRAFENGKTKRWYQDIFIDVEWSTE